MADKVEVGDKVRIVPFTTQWYAGLTKGVVHSIGTKFVHVRSPWGRVFRVDPDHVRKPS